MSGTSADYTDAGVGVSKSYSATETKMHETGPFTFSLLVHNTKVDIHAPPESESY
jgi:hypothetical protein